MAILKKVGFYIVSFTWGIIPTIIGFMLALALWVSGHKSSMWNYVVCFRVGKNWGGLSLGPFVFTDDRPTYHMLQHEHGHSIQNLMLGPLWVLIVGTPSMCRYLYREQILYRINKKAYSELPYYEDIFFERWATKLGEKYFPKEGGGWVKDGN